MGGFLSIFSPPKAPSPPGPDPALAAARAKAEADAKAEKEKLAAEQAEDEANIRRGRRGRRSLISPEGSEIGFPSVLGG